MSIQTRLADAALIETPHVTESSDQTNNPQRRGRNGVEGGGGVSWAERRRVNGWEGWMAATLELADGPQINERRRVINPRRAAVCLSASDKEISASVSLISACLRLRRAPALSPHLFRITKFPP